MRRIFHELACRVGGDFGRGGELSNPVIAEDCDTVGELWRFVMVVGEVHRSEVQFVVDGPQRAAQLAPDLGVKRVNGSSPSPLSNQA